MSTFEVCRRAIITTYQFPAAKKNSHKVEAICATQPASQPVQDGVQTLKSYGIAIDNRGTS